MTIMVPAYDVEMPGACLTACKRIVEVHKQHQMPGTFFITGLVLEDDGTEFKRLLDDTDLFEVATHTYSHKLFRDHPVCGPASPLNEIREEIFKGKQLVEDVFERECVGLRPGCCFEDGFKHAPEIVDLIQQSGLRYTSSQAWGPFCTCPAPVVDAYTYKDEGFESIWEFPGHGWHENVLKGHNATPGRLLLWPPIYPEFELSGYVQTPQEEFDVHKFFIDKAHSGASSYASLVWHPWSLGKFDPEMRMLDLLFSYTRSQGLEADTFKGLLARRQ